MGLGSRPTVVPGDAATEMLRQQLKRIRHWDCPAVTSDPLFGQMPPGMLWIRSDMPEGCERYRFYNEKGEVVTMCFTDSGADTDTDVNSLELVKSVCRDAASPDVVSNTTTETDFVTQHTIPANTTEQYDLFRVKIHGVTRVDAVVSAGVRYRLYFNEYPIGDTQTQTMTSPNTNAPWSFEFDVIIETVNDPVFGAAHVGGFLMMVHGSATVPVYRIIPFNTGSGTGIAYSHNAPTIIKVSADWDTADTDNASELIMFDVIKGRVGGF